MRTAEVSIEFIELEIAELCKPFGAEVVHVSRETGRYGAFLALSIRRDGKRFEDGVPIKPYPLWESMRERLGRSIERALTASTGVS